MNIYLYLLYVVEIPLGECGYWLRYQKHISTNEKCPFWQIDQSESFSVLNELLELPCQTKHRILLGDSMRLQ